MNFIIAVNILQEENIIMKKLLCISLLLLSAAASFAQWAYPPTRTADSSSTYWGRTYKDPYRWLENIESKEVGDWFKAQATLTDSLLNRIPGRDLLVKEWMSLDSLKPASYSDIVVEKNRLFYRKTKGGENVGKIYWREGWSGDEKLLFDPTTYQKDVTTTVVSFLPSYDGKEVALALSSGGAEVSHIRILDVNAGTLLPDSLFPNRGPICWTFDNSTIFYQWQSTGDSKDPAAELNGKTKSHKIGTDPASDVDYFSGTSYPGLNITPREWPTAYIDETCPDYIFGDLSTVQPEIRLYYAPIGEMSKPKIDWKPFCTISDSLVRGFDIHGNKAYAITSKGAPSYRLILTSVDHPDWTHAETILPEQKDVMQYFVKGRDYLLAVYSNGITGRVVAYHFDDGKMSQLSLPMSGTVEVSCPDRFTNEFLVTITSWTQPATWYNYDADKQTFTKSIFNSDVKYPGFENLVSEEVEVPGHDGTMIPLSIVYEKGLKKDGNNCCLLDGYGSYSMSYSPGFSIRRSIALKGVVLAYAHVRGGGEKGESWYRAGYKTTKPNTWKDFISCAEYLVKNGYTSHEKLAGTGTSAGGILISRAITERPDLFGAAICNVGCANAMRMEFTPNGPVNAPEFGTVKDSVECLALYEMDGVQHVQKGVKYPALICVGGWNDPRVVAWEPGKFAAAVQNASISRQTGADAGKL